MMLLGKIRWFNYLKGYGFIQMKKGPDVFVHYTDIKGEGFRSLYQGQDVCYQLWRGKHGLVAKDVRPIKNTEPPRPRMRFH